jgi:hypothetical protein
MLARETAGQQRERGSPLPRRDVTCMGQHASAPTKGPATSLGMGGLSLGTRGSSAGGPTSTKTLLARSRSGATPFKHGNGHLQVCKRYDERYAWTEHGPHTSQSRRAVRPTRLRPRPPHSRRGWCSRFCVGARSASNVGESSLHALASAPVPSADRTCSDQQKSESHGGPTCRLRTPHIYARY